MHCFKCGAALPPEAATCPACRAATPYNVTASTPEIADARTDSAATDNTGEGEASPVSQVEETPPVERTIPQQSQQLETPQPQSVTERTVLQEPPQLEMPASQVEQTVPQQPSQADQPVTSPAWQQPQPMQGQPTPQQGAIQAQQGQLWPQPFPGQQPPQQGPRRLQPGPSQPPGPQSHPAWQQPQPFPGQQPLQQGPWQPQSAMPQSMPGPQPPQLGLQQPQPGMAQPFPAWQQPQPGAVQPRPQPWVGQPQMQSSPVWQQPMAQPLPGQQAFQATSAPAAQTLPKQLAQRRGLSLAMILLLIIIAFVIIGTSGLIYYTAAIHPANLQAQATSVAQSFLTAQAQSMSPQGIYAQATSGKPTINDTLSNPANSIWQNSSTPQGSCAFTQGAFHITDRGNFTFFCYSQMRFSNFAFQVRMTILKGTVGGLVFRADGSLALHYLFGIHTSGFYTFDVLTTSELKQLSYGPSAAIKTEPGQPNLLTVIARGSTMYLYINKQFVASAQDSTYSSGQVGLFATNQIDSTEIAFSNAQVWVL